MKKTKMAFYNILFKTLLFTVTLTLFLITNLFSEELASDLNNHYRFPFSTGIEYQSYSYFYKDRNSDNIMGLAIQTRYPLPFLPVLQPAIDLGIIYTDNQDQLHTRQWNHTQYYMLTGLLYANRLLKNFELGVEIMGGAAYVIFPDILNDKQMYCSVDLIGQAGLYLCLVPNYNFMLAIHPNLKYCYSLSSIDNYNGLIMGIGLSMHYRTGDDPDRPQVPLNSLYLGVPGIPPVYANMQHYYTNHPLGTLVITNTEKRELKDVEVYFSQATYVDSQIHCSTKEELAPGQSWEADIYATFNDKIFDIEGSQPANGEIIVTYKVSGRNGEQRKFITFELYDKTTVTWNDYNKAAALITPADSILKNYCSFIQRQCETETITDFNRNLQSAIQLYNALTELNVIYQPDPVLPFNAIKTGDNTVKDTVYLPRDTLMRGSGDCDDLTVLFCSLLESIGIETGYLVFPGHILPVFNTGEQARSFGNLHPSREMSIQYAGKLWLPVEITLLGKADFSTAWYKGIEQYLSGRENGRLFITKTAWEIYKPVSLKEKDSGLQYGNMENVKKEFKTDMNQIINNIIAGYIRKSEENEDKIIYNTIGSLYGNIGEFAKAEQAFQKALDLDAGYLYARINLGILNFRKKEFGQALMNFMECNAQLALSTGYPSVVLARIYSYTGKCYKALGENNKAREYNEMCYELEKQLFVQNTTKTEENLNIESKEFSGFILEQRL